MIKVNEFTYMNKKEVKEWVIQRLSDMTESTKNGWAGIEWRDGTLCCEIDCKLSNWNEPDTNLYPYYFMTYLPQYANKYHCFALLRVGRQMNEDKEPNAVQTVKYMSPLEAFKMFDDNFKPIDDIGFTRSVMERDEEEQPEVSEMLEQANETVSE